MSSPVLVFRADVSGTAFGAAPTWTTYSSSVMAGPGYEATVTFGGQDETGITPSSCSFFLENADGRWTPGSAAAISGWNLGIRVNLRLTVGATTYDRFDGYIDSIEPTWPGGVQSWSVVKVSATDLTAKLGLRLPLRPMVEHEMLADSPTYLYPLSEPAPSRSAADIVSTSNPVAVRKDSKYGAATCDFGSTLEGMIDGDLGVSFGSSYTGVSAAASPLAICYDSTAGPFIPTSGAHTVECWFVAPTSAPASSNYGDILVQSSGNSGGAYAILQVTSGGYLQYALSSSNGTDTATPSSFSGSQQVIDGKLHHAAATLASDMKTAKLYLDGVLMATYVAANAMDFSGMRFNTIGAILLSSAGTASGWQFPGIVGKVALYPSALSAARILAHYQAGVGTYSEASGARYSRIAGYGNVTTSGLPTGVATMGGQALAGRSLVEALAEVASTEGSVSYATPAGALTFAARNARYNAASVLSIATSDIRPPVPRVDRQGVMNQITAQRPGGASQLYANATAQTADGIADGGSFTVAPSTDYDALQNAAWKVETHLDPQTRITSVDVDLLKANDTLAGNCLALDIGDLITVTGLPAQAPASSMSLFVEGWTDTIGLNQWRTEFFTSPNLPYVTLRADAAASTYTKLDNGLKIPF